MEQAAAYLGQTGTPPGEYLALLRTHAERLLSRGHVLGHEHTVATVWEPSYERVVAADPAAGDLLRLCAFLGPEPIPLDLFTGHADRLPEALAGAVATCASRCSCTSCCTGLS